MNIDIFLRKKNKVAFIRQFANFLSYDSIAQPSLGSLLGCQLGHNVLTRNDHQALMVFKAIKEGVDLVSCKSSAFFLQKKRREEEASIFS